MINKDYLFVPRCPKVIINLAEMSPLEAFKAGWEGAVIQSCKRYWKLNDEEWTQEDKERILKMIRR